MKIQVKQEHIDKGKQRSICECPIALAAKEQLNFVEVSVGYMVSGNFTEKNMVHGNYIRNNDQWDAGGVVPIVAKEFMTRFDNGQTVEPFEFDIDLSIRVTHD